MSSAYPPPASMPRRSCHYCGAPLVHSLYCSKCGYYNFGPKTDILAQGTQPGSGGMHGDIEEQPTDLLEVQNSVSREQMQLAPSALQETPALSQYIDVHMQNSSAMALSSGAGNSTKQNCINTTDSSSSYVTQPTQIMPVAQNAAGTQAFKSSRPKQVPQFRGKGRMPILGIVILITIVIGGGVGSYLLAYWPAVQKSMVTTSSIQPQRVLKFADTFKDNSNQWNLQSEPGKYLVTIGDKSLILEDDNNSLLPEVLPGNSSFKDFKLAVDATLSKGNAKNGYGIYIRCSLDQNGNPTTYYRFELYGDGTYAIFKSVVDSRKVSAILLKLVSYTMNNVIQKQGSKNHIEIDAKGNIVIIRINGQVVKTFSDSSYGAGTIALFVSNVQNASPGAQVKFSNLIISSDA